MTLPLPESFDGAFISFERQEPLDENTWKHTTKVTPAFPGVRGVWCLKPTKGFDHCDLTDEHNGDRKLAWHLSFTATKGTWSIMSSYNSLKSCSIPLNWKESDDDEFRVYQTETLG